MSATTWKVFEKKKLRKLKIFQKIHKQLCKLRKHWEINKNNSNLNWNGEVTLKLPTVLHKQHIQVNAKKLIFLRNSSVFLTVYGNYDFNTATTTRHTDSNNHSTSLSTPQPSSSTPPPPQQPTAAPPFAFASHNDDDDHTSRCRRYCRRRRHGVVNWEITLFLRG